MLPRTIFITGASSGVGRALALEYARKGAHVAAAARRVPELERLTADVDRARAHDVRYGKISIYPLDVADPAAVFDTVRRAERELGSLDMVIANAGASAYQHVTTMSWGEVAHVMDVNVRGAMATLLAAVPIMMSHQHGHLVGVSTLAGRRGSPRAAVYCASKAALSNFLESLRIELQPAGVRVTDVQPGFIETAMTAGREFPTPWMWSPKKAAQVTVRRLERAPAVIAFPWPLDALGAITRFLPPFLYDRLARAAAR